MSLKSVCLLLSPPPRTAKSLRIAASVSLSHPRPARWASTCGAAADVSRATCSYPRCRGVRRRGRGHLTMRSWPGPRPCPSGPLPASTSRRWILNGECGQSIKNTNIHALRKESARCFKQGINCMFGSLFWAPRKCETYMVLFKSVLWLLPDSLKHASVVEEVKETHLTVSWWWSCLVGLLFFFCFRITSC